MVVDFAPLARDGDGGEWLLAACARRRRDGVRGGVLVVMTLARGSNCVSSRTASPARCLFVGGSEMTEEAAATGAGQLEDGVSTRRPERSNASPSLGVVGMSPALIEVSLPTLVSKLMELSSSPDADVMDGSLSSKARAGAWAGFEVEGPAKRDIDVPDVVCATAASSYRWLRVFIRL